MIAWLSWYLVITLSGWLAFPILYRLLPGLADRGYGVSRVFAWLLWGYMFWLLASLGILRNNFMGILLAWLLLALLGWFFVRRGGWQEIAAWLRAHGRLVATIEVLFLIAFGLWALVRATNPEALGTEKPMELAFINAILRSETFPPHDPWLSGYSISYYYFGYVLVALLAKASAISGGVAFNLGIALVFALSASGVYSLVYNLLSRGQPSGQAHRLHWYACLGPLFLLIFSNLEGFLHVLHTRGVFWKQAASGEWFSRFWQWLDVVDLNTAPAQPFHWVPDRFWWWWRASRVVQDYDLANGAREIIDEFPFFSYLLADLHPHVLAMPFAFLALTLALHVFFDARQHAPLTIGPLKLYLAPQQLLFTSLACGSLLFLNTWDFPIYAVLFSLAYALRQSQRPSGAGAPLPSLASRLAQGIKDTLLLLVTLGLLGLLWTLPFFLAFSSQAGGLVINLIYPTRGAHLWVMFGGLLLCLGATLALLLRQAGQRPGARRAGRIFAQGLLLSLVLCAGLWLASLLLAALALRQPELASYYLNSLAAPDAAALFQAAFLRRLSAPGGWATLALVLAPCLGLLLEWLRAQETAQDAAQVAAQDAAEVHLTQPAIFSVVLILLGGLLILFPEFFFLRDQFGWRMNTIFKFYFQAWLLWAAAAAFGSATLLQSCRGWRAWAWRLALILILASGLVYPFFALASKTNQFQFSSAGLDGAAYLETQNPDEMGAVRWLSQAPFGVLAEAVSPSGGSYTAYARMATLSGLPGVLGWVGHESQWRGGSLEIGTRQADLTTLYCSRSGLEVQTVIERYSIRYVVIGSLERSTYALGSEGCKSGINEAFLLKTLTPIFREGSVTILMASGK